MAPPLSFRWSLWTSAVAYVAAGSICILRCWKTVINDKDDLLGMKICKENHELFPLPMRPSMDNQKRTTTTRSQRVRLLNINHRPPPLVHVLLMDNSVR